MRTSKVYAISNFQIHSTVLLTVVTLLYITSPELIHLIPGSFCLLTTFAHFPHHLPPASGNHQSAPCENQYLNGQNQDPEYRTSLSQISQV